MFILQFTFNARPARKRVELVFIGAFIRIVDLRSDLLDHYVVLDSVHNFLLVGVLVSRQFDRIFVLLSLFPLD